MGRAERNEIMAESSHPLYIFICRDIYLCVCLFVCVPLVKLGQKWSSSRTWGNRWELASFSEAAQGFLVRDLKTLVKRLMLRWACRGLFLEGICGILWGAVMQRFLSFLESISCNFVGWFVMWCYKILPRFFRVCWRQSSGFCCCYCCCCYSFQDSWIWRSPGGFKDSSKAADGSWGILGVSPLIAELLQRIFAAPEGFAIDWDRRGRPRLCQGFLYQFLGWPRFLKRCSDPTRSDTQVAPRYVK